MRFRREELACNDRDRDFAYWEMVMQRMMKDLACDDRDQDVGGSEGMVRTTRRVLSADDQGRHVGQGSKGVSYPWKMLMDNSCSFHAEKGVMMNGFCDVCGEKTIFGWNCRNWELVVDCGP